MTAPERGLASSEFVALAGLFGLMIANGTSWVEIPWDEMQWFGGVVAAYGAYRTGLKGWQARQAAPVSGKEGAQP